MLVRQDSPSRPWPSCEAAAAVQRGSSAHYLLVRAPSEGGRSAVDRHQPIYLAPADARAAFERGSVDAWAVWDPTTPLPRLMAPRARWPLSRGLTNNNTFYLASARLTANGPALRAAFKALTETDAWVQSHRKEAAERLPTLPVWASRPCTACWSAASPRPWRH